MASLTWWKDRALWCLRRLACGIVELSTTDLLSPNMYAFLQTGTPLIQWIFILKMFLITKSASDCYLFHHNMFKKNTENRQIKLLILYLCHISSSASGISFWLDTFWIFLGLSSISDCFMYLFAIIFIVANPADTNSSSCGMIMQLILVFNTNNVLIFRKHSVFCRYFGLRPINKFKYNSLINNIMHFMLLPTYNFHTSMTKGLNQSKSFPLIIGLGKLLKTLIQNTQHWEKLAIAVAHYF